jgi:hypothetical protein
LVTVAALTVVLLGFAALSIDIGTLHSARTAAQRAADAAALAGAFAFVTRPNLVDDAAGRDAIKQHAISVGNVNKILSTPVSIATSDVTVEFSIRRVTVNVNHTQPSLFARVLGQNSTAIRATAIAEAALSATGARCTKPWFIPNTVLASGNGQSAVCDACNASPPQILIDSSGQVSQFANDWMAAEDAKPPAQNPRQFTIKPQNPNATISPGQFYAIRLGSSSGAQDYEENIYTCAEDGTVFCQQSYPSEPGNMVGPTRMGVNQLVNYNGDPNCNNCDRDTYVAIGQYQRPASQGGGISSTSRSLVIAPIIEVCGFCPDNFPSGTEEAQFTVVGFALVFIEGIQGNDVQARLINVTDCSGGGGGGGGGGGIDPSETGPFSVPVRLVRL